MSILNLSRGDVVSFVRTGLKSVVEYDICKELSEGKTQRDIAGKFGIDERQVRRIKLRLCPECGNARH